MLKTKEINIMTYHETDMVYDYLSQEPGCKVFKIVQRPYDIYIAPTENMTHDGTTLGKMEIDVTLVMIGYFSIKTSR